ncbi:MAG: hypothetical protein PF439_05025 [Helicobacteraceae bacterium]|jgi:uncharacterized membrane protein YraQ (UPF0718 family)|nr:hypothetical protein [Helicobacteraceae bacterium]
MPDDKNQQFSTSEQLNCESQKKNRRFRTLDELQEEYDEKEHDFKDEVNDVWQNLKREIFSIWGMLILSALTLGILSAIVR